LKPVIRNDRLYLITKTYHKTKEKINMKKRFLIVLFTMTIALSLCACNKNTNETVSNDVKNPPTEIETTTQEESSTETETTTQEESSTEIESNLESDTESNTEIDSSKTDSAESTKFTTTPLDTTMYATQQCNIRKGPSTDNDIIGALSQAEGIHITGRVDDLNWYEVSLADGSVGYISGKLLTETKPAVQVEASNPTPQQEAVSQSNNTSHSNEVINELTGEPYKPGDPVPGGGTFIGEAQYTEDGNTIIFPDGTVAHRVNK